MARGRTNSLEAHTPEGKQSRQPIPRKKETPKQCQCQEGEATSREEGGNGRHVEYPRQRTWQMANRRKTRKQVAKNVVIEDGRLERGSRTDARDANVGNQRGETSEGREPQECDRDETRSGFIGRRKASRGCENLRTHRSPSEVSSDNLLLNLSPESEGVMAKSEENRRKSSFMTRSRGFPMTQALKGRKANPCEHAWRFVCNGREPVQKEATRPHDEAKL